MRIRAPLKRAPKTDEVQREFWQYRRLWGAIIILLIGARLFLTHFPILRGWEQKFSTVAFEIGKADAPSSAIKSNNVDMINILLKPNFEIPAGLANINDAILYAVWPCKPLNAPGVCLKYFWKGEPLTMIISLKPGRVTSLYGPYTRAGWGGYFIVQKDLAATAVGPFDPQDILSQWPYATNFVSQHPPKK